MKKLVSVLLAFCMLLCAAGAAAEDSAAQVEKRTFPLYHDKSGEVPVDPAFPLYFAGGVSDLPYVEIRDLVDLANRMKDAPGIGSQTWLIECDEEKGIAGILVDGSTSLLAMDFAGKNLPCPEAGQNSFEASRHDRAIPPDDPPVRSGTDNAQNARRSDDTHS